MGGHIKCAQAQADIFLQRQISKFEQQQEICPTDCVVARTCGALLWVLLNPSLVPHVRVLFLKSKRNMSTYHYAPGAIHNDHHKEVTVNASAANVADIIKSFMQDDEPQEAKVQFEDITPIDTSFFCTDHFAPDIIEKNLRQAIELASSKADVCRRIMALEPLGYVVLSNVTDERKAVLINQFAMPKYKLTGFDFTKARNRKNA